MDKPSKNLKSSSKQKKAPWQRLGIMEPEDPEESILYLSTMMLNARVDGYKQLYILLDKAHLLEAFLALRSFIQLTDPIGTSSATLSSNGYTIDIFVKGGMLYLAILQKQGHGLLGRVKKTVTMWARLIFLRLAIWLGGLTNFGK